MQRYFLKITAPRDAFNAEGKAPADVENILRQEGFKPLEIRAPRWDDLLGINARLCYQPLEKLLQKAEELFIQYPFYAPHSHLIIRKFSTPTCPSPCWYTTSICCAADTRSQNRSCGKPGD